MIRNNLNFLTTSDTIYVLQAGFNYGALFSRSQKILICHRRHDYVDGEPK